MPRKPNYRFERHERERAKAAKKAAKREAKAEKKGEPETADTADGDRPIDAKRRSLIRTLLRRERRRPNPPCLMTVVRRQCF